MTKPIPAKQIDGDVAVGRNVAAGGDANVQGSARVGHDLVVEGYLVAKNIKSPCKGLFKTAAILKECFPRPHDGWWAMVGTSVPAYVYVAEGGEWVATGGVAPTKEGMDIYTQSLENEKGKAGGIAPLDASAKVPLANLPLRTVEVAVFHSIVHVGAILNITSEHKSTDDGYGVVYDPERKRFYLTATGQQNPNADVTLIQGYGYWADEDIFGAEPAEGYGREPVGFKLYRCATDGSLYYWDGTDLVDFNKEVNDALDLHKDGINNLKNEVDNIKKDATDLSDTVSTLQQDCGDTAKDVSTLKAAIEIRCDDLLKGGTWTWGLAATKLTDIKAGRRINLHYGDDADTDIEGVVLSVETGENQFEVAVYDGATKSSGMLVLVFTIGATAKTMTAKRLVESTDARLKHIYEVRFTYDADGAKSTWNAGVEAGVVRQGDELRWLEGENAGVYDVFATVVGETKRDLCAVYFMEEEQQTLRVIWLCYDGSVLETTFDSADVISDALNKKQDSLVDSDDITVGINNKLSLTEKHVRKTHTITLTADTDGPLSWSGADHSKIRNGDIVEWENMGVLFRGTVISRTSSGSYDTLAVVYDFDGDEPLELHVLWINSNGTATDACFLSDQTLASAFNAKQTKLENTTDVVIEGETDSTDGLYLTDSAKRAVFNDLFNSEGNISNRAHDARPVTAKYDPENAPDASHPYWCNKIWLTYEEAVDAYNHRLTPSASPAGAIRQCVPLRTAICSLHTIWDEKLSFSSTFRNLSKLEVARLSTNDIQGVWVSNMQGAFQGCLKLKEIIPAIIDSTDSSLSWNVAFADCAELESFQIKGLRHNLNLKWSPKLSLATMQYLVDNASTEITAESPVVVTVHADVFAKLTGDCDGVTMVPYAPTTRDKSAVPIVIANPGMFAVSDILTAPDILGDDGLPLRLTVTAVDAEGQPSVAPINAGALGGLSGCNIMLADSEPAQWAAVLNAAYEKNISFATD